MLTEKTHLCQNVNIIGKIAHMLQNYFYAKRTNKSLKLTETFFRNSKVKFNSLFLAQCSEIT